MEHEPLVLTKEYMRFDPLYAEVVAAAKHNNCSQAVADKIVRKALIINAISCLKDKDLKEILTAIVRII